MLKKSSTFAPDLKKRSNRHNKTNLFCTLNKQTNTLEKQASG